MLSTVVRLVAFLLMLPIGYFYITSGLVVPGPYLFLLWAAWGAFLTMAVMKRNDWRFVVAAPIGATVLWFATLWLGGTLLGWTP